MTESKTTIIPPEGGWKERTYYVVDVAYSKQNMPPHRAIFYTGFLNGKDGTPGGYEAIFQGSYEQQYSWRDAYYLKAVCEIPEIGEGKVNVAA